MRRALKRWTCVLVVSTALHLAAALAVVPSSPMSGGRGGGQGVSVSIEIGGGGSGQPAQPVVAGSAAVVAPPRPNEVATVEAEDVASQAPVPEASAPEEPPSAELVESAPEALSQQPQSARQDEPQSASEAPSLSAAPDFAARPAAGLHPDPVVAVPAVAVAPHVVARTDAVATETPAEADASESAVVAVPAEPPTVEPQMVEAAEPPADVAVSAVDRIPTGPQPPAPAEVIQQAEPMQAAQSAPQQAETAEATPAVVPVPAAGNPPQQPLPALQPTRNVADDQRLEPADEVPAVPPQLTADASPDLAVTPDVPRAAEAQPSLEVAEVLLANATITDPTEAVDAGAPPDADAEVVANDMPAPPPMMPSRSADPQPAPPPPPQQATAPPAATPEPAAPAAPDGASSEDIASAGNGQATDQAAGDSEGPGPDGAAGGGSLGPGGPSAAAVQASYIAALQAQLARSQSYPERARDRGQEGVAMLAFTIDGNGNLVQASIQASSGHSLLDDATLDMVRRAAPFPPIPTALGRSTLALVVPIQFHLR